MDSRTPDRVLRGVIAASAATAVALLGHVLAGGEAPGAAGLLVPWWLSVSLCTALAGRTVSLSRTAAAVLLSQSAFHLLFVLGSTGTGTVSLPARHHGHGGHAASPLDLAGGGTPSALAGSSAHPAAGMDQALLHSAHLDASMLLGHLAAAVVTIALLHHGERLLACAGAVGLDALDQLGLRGAAILLAACRGLLSPRRSSARMVCADAPHLRGRAAAAPDRGRAPPLLLAA